MICHDITVAHSFVDQMKIAPLSASGVSSTTIANIAITKIASITEKARTIGRTMTMNEQIDVLHSDFDIETHKRTFVNYLEVVIREDGKIEYAVPSHQEKLIAIARAKLGVTRKELCDMCPREYMFDYNTWLCGITNCVSVWNDFHMGTPNEKQRGALQTLKVHGLYRGTMKGE